MTPFILVFAQQLPPAPQRQTRYDRARQVLQVYELDQWIDAIDANGPMPDTIITKVDRETADDA